MAFFTHRLGVRVSIIIPCFNYGHFLPESLDSIRQQTSGAWECLVIDDGSDDATADIVKRMEALDNRFRYIYQENQGQPAARNNGLKQASGEYVQFLDADDLLAPDKLKVQMDWLDTHPEDSIVYGKVRYFESGKKNEPFLDRWGERMTEWMPMISGQGIPILRALTEKNIMELGCALFRASGLGRLGNFDSSLQGVEDYDYCFRAAAAGFSFHFLDTPGTEVFMRHHPDSFSKNRITMYKKELGLRRSIRATLREMGHHELAMLNENRYALRLRRLQDLIIDRTIKQKDRRPDRKELQWMALHSSLRQNLYFFPRMVKAYISP
ncbi:MAG TPA: glycosyltransferase family 2 protein [Puia sp.]|nr:glycosyltransferase family 2 protein [Puia sp.]